MTSTGPGRPGLKSPATLSATSPDSVVIRTSCQPGREANHSMDYINPLPPYERLDEMDKPHEECGVFGVYAPGEDVARVTFFALYALQHRGQESAGIATSDGHHIASHTSLG